MADILPELMGLEEHVAVYALVGMCVSEVAEIEWCLFQCLGLTSGLELPEAHASFTATQKFKDRRKLVDKAVRAWPKMPPEWIPEWEALVRRLQTLCGPNGVRNVVGHTPVRAGIWLTDPEANPPNFLEVVTKWGVSQNANDVMSGRRPLRDEDCGSMSGHVRDLRAGSLAIMKFWSRLVGVNQERG